MRGGQVVAWQRRTWPAWSPFVNTNLGVHGTYSFVLPDVGPGVIGELREADNTDEDVEE